MFLARPERAVWAGIALLAAVLVTALLVPSGPLALDSSWSRLMGDWRSPTLDHLAQSYDDLGRGVLRAVAIGAIGVVLLAARRWLALASFAVVEALTPLAVALLRHLVDRPRPPDPSIHVSGASFPSGHAAYAGATCVALVVLFSPVDRRRPLWWAIAAIEIAGMAWSRTYLQVHWLSDVVAGAVLGTGIALLVFGAGQVATGYSSSSMRFSRRRTTT
jgi:membrane-associated phospholipid phosphatase